MKKECKFLKHLKEIIIKKCKKVEKTEKMNIKDKF